MHHRSPPPPTPPRELRLPLAVVTPKRKRTARGSPRQAVIRSVGLRPLAHRVPPSASTPRRQIPAPPAAAGDYNYALKNLARLAVLLADVEAAARAAPAAENLRSSPPPLDPPLAVNHQNPSSFSIDHGNAPPLAPLAVDHLNPSSMSIEHGDAPPLAPLAVDNQNPSSMSIDHGDGDASPKASAAAPPVPVPGENLRSSPPLPPAVAADEEKKKPYDAPSLPPLAVDEPQSSMSMDMDHDHAATKASAENCKKPAFPQGNVGSSKGDQHGGGVASPAAGGGASPMQLDDDTEELEPGEIPSVKPDAGRNAGSALGSILGKYKPPIAWVPAAGCNADSAHGSSILGKYKPPIAWEPAMAGGSAHRTAWPAAVAMSTGVVVGRDGGKAAVEISAAAMEKKKREVFVGGLSRDAVEEDVRAALSPAGGITQVRMFINKETGKNKGYCFVAYRDAAMASKAVAEFGLGNLKICGKRCRVTVPEGNEKTNKIAQRDPTIEDYNSKYEQRQAVQSSYITSWDHHAASHAASPAGYMPAGYYIPMYHNGNVVYLPAGPNHGLTGPSGRSQMGQSGSGKPAGQPHRSRN